MFKRAAVVLAVLCSLRAGATPPASEFPSGANRYNVGSYFPLFIDYRDGSVYINLGGTWSLAFTPSGGAGNPGVGLELNGSALDFIASELDSLTWGTNAVGSIVWTWRVTGGGTDPTMTVSESEVAFNKAVRSVGGLDNQHGFTSDINTTDCENPPGLKASYCWHGSPAKPAGRRNGENTYDLMWLNGGAYGPITCTSGVCTLNVNSVDGTHLNLTGNVTGDLARYNGTDWVPFHIGGGLQVLRTNAGATDIEWGASSSGGDNIKINGVDFTGSFANFLGAGEASGDIVVTKCTGAGTPVANCAAADDIVWNFVAQRIEDGDINNFAAIQERKIAGTGVTSMAGIYGGDPALLATDTGNAVCGDSLINKTCTTTFVETTGAEQACTFTHTLKFRAWCR